MKFLTLTVFLILAQTNTEIVNSPQFRAKLKLWIWAGKTLDNKNQAFLRKLEKHRPNLKPRVFKSYFRLRKNHPYTAKLFDKAILDSKVHFRLKIARKKYFDSLRWEDYSQEDDMNFLLYRINRHKMVVLQNFHEIIPPKFQFFFEAFAMLDNLGNLAFSGDLIKDRALLMQHANFRDPDMEIFFGAL